MYPIIPHTLSCFVARRWRSSGFEAHSSHQLFIDSPSHSRHQGATQRPGDSPTEKPARAVLLEVEEETRKDQYDTDVVAKLHPSRPQQWAAFLPEN